MDHIDYDIVILLRLDNKKRGGKMGKFAIFCVVLLLSCNVLAVFANLDDLNPPGWRTEPAGMTPTTVQGWGLSNNANPAEADVAINDFGNPTLEFIINSPTGGYLQTYDAGSGEHNGVWMLTALDYIDINIPNTGNNIPGTWKEIWLQVIYSDPGGTGAQIPINTIPNYSSLVRQPLQDFGDGFLLDTYHITIEPNPSSEEIIAFSIQCQIYIDEIIVDTICVPEPATFAVLGLGFATLILLKKPRLRN